eukprot:4428146-Prymnesium_polylepis.1
MRRAAREEAHKRRAPLLAVAAHPCQPCSFFLLLGVPGALARRRARQPARRGAAARRPASRRPAR